MAPLNGSATGTQANDGAQTYRPPMPAASGEARRMGVLASQVPPAAVAVTDQARSDGTADPVPAGASPGYVPPGAGTDMGVASHEQGGGPVRLRPAHRRRRRVVVVTTLVATVLVAGGLRLSRTSHSAQPYPDRWDARIANLADFVERERGLKFKHPVYVDFLADADFRTLASGLLSAADERAREEAFAAVLRAFGLVPADLDLGKASRKLLAEAVDGFYHFDTERIVMRGETMDDLRRSLLVHELTHALQDQHFGLGNRSSTLTSGARLARTVVAEGDAASVSSSWERDLSPKARQALVAERERLVRDLDFDGVPPVLVESFYYPYMFGPELVRIVVGVRGTAGRNALFTDAPLSEEQVILPASYLEHQGVEKVPVPPLQPGEEALADAEDDFGMVSLLTVLGERLDFRTAWAAVQGWSGDAMVVFTRQDVMCGRVHVAFDDETRAARFEAAFDEWGSGLPTSHARSGRFVTVESCDPGPAASGRPPGHVAAFEGLTLRATLLNGIAPQVTRRPPHVWSTWSWSGSVPSAFARSSPTLPPTRGTKLRRSWRTPSEKGSGAARRSGTETATHRLGETGPSAASSAVHRDWDEGRSRGVIGSPHFFTPGGDFFCPALDVRQVDGHVRITPDPDGFERVYRRWEVVPRHREHRRRPHPPAGASVGRAGPSRRCVRVADASP